MNGFVKTGGSLKGALAAVCLALALGLVTSNCGQTMAHYAPAQIGTTKLEVFVINLTIPGAPRNTAYLGGEAEIVAHIQGTGTHVAFYLPGGVGWPWNIFGSTITPATFDPATGVMLTPDIYYYENSCENDNWAHNACMGLDGWAYVRVDSQGHARMMFRVGNKYGYYDVLSRPALFNGSGVITQKLEYETRTRVDFNRETYEIYQ